METPIIQQRMTTYRQWKVRATRAVLDFDKWLINSKRGTPEIHEQNQSTLEDLRKDRLTVALVAEFSRGKSELINAVFFADYGRRVLPSSAGRTTMCPTELFWDKDLNEPYLRLLPVETRGHKATIATLRDDPSQWVNHPLNAKRPEQMTESLQEIMQTKWVSAAEAARLGLSGIQLGEAGLSSPDRVEIPKWRHALISFPHPLLKQGLVILDTPGLNALGSEPELTLGMLPAAHAALFVLSADTGVTGSDLDMWRHHLKGFQNHRQRGIMVVLNKVDMLWDELQTPEEIQKQIDKQRATTATALGVDQEIVFAVSAQKALFAKIRGNEALLRRSGLRDLEEYLSAIMLEAKHHHLQARMEATIGKLLDQNRARFSSRIKDVQGQLQDIEQLRNKSDDVISQLLDKTRQEQELYLRGVKQFQGIREALIKDTQRCREILDRGNVEALIERTRRDMLGSWTTRGLTRSMKALFGELRHGMQTIATDCARARRTVRNTYGAYNEDYGFDLQVPSVFAPTRYRVEIELLYQEVDAFARSPAMTFSNQGVVIKRFHEQMVSRAASLFEQLRTVFEVWTRDTLQPLAEEIEERRDLMEKRLENLQRIGHSKENLQQRVDGLQEHYVELAKQLTALRNIHSSLHYEPQFDPESAGMPKATAGVG